MWCLFASLLYAIFACVFGIVDCICAAVQRGVNQVLRFWVQAVMGLTEGVTKRCGGRVPAEGMNMK